MGPLFCLLSAAGFGAMAIFAKLAYAEGVEVDALLVVRFGLAGLALLVLSLTSGELVRLDRRSVAVGLAMGAFGYSAQAGLYLVAVSRVHASQVALVFGVYPVLVMAAAIAIRRERASVRRAVALGVAITGIVLVQGGAATGDFDAIGVLLSLGSAVVYTAYILVGDRVAGEVPPVPLTALVCSGAFVTWLTVATLRGGVALQVGVQGWFWLVMLVLVSTVAAILLFFAGLSRVGPTVAALLAVGEPVVTVLAAALVFSESLSSVQAIGGLLVLSAVVAVQWPVSPRGGSRTRRRPPRHDPDRSVFQPACAGASAPGRPSRASTSSPGPRRRTHPRTRRPGTSAGVP
ncbi:conserved membrane hypothetical protein [metagenome]|uniref:EamA domain-containing protein n=1 Tax=metagenome TaxID=256318 RepID=A0A2P2C4Z8_9ZZZZ